MADRIYLLRPGFLDGGAGPFFCGECALVEGMLSFYPAIRNRVDVHYVDFERPRPAIVAELGEAHQSAPVLVLDEAPADLPPTVQVKEAEGKRYVDDPNGICIYLARRYATGTPHHPV